MTTTIKASCPRCGDIELTPAQVRLMVCTSTAPSYAALSYYAFDCHSCACEVRKPADDHVVSLLVSGGVQAQVWEVPAEARECHEGAPIGYDDLLDFVLALHGTEHLTAFAATPAARP